MCTCSKFSPFLNCHNNNYRFVVIASKQLPILEAIITFQKLRKFNFGKVIIASSRGKTLLETKMSLVRIIKK